MPKTYEPISTNTLGTATASVTFSSIPATYTDLIVVCVMQNSAAAAMVLQFNSDTATNYSNTGLQGDGTSASSRRLSTRSQIYIMEREQIAQATSTFSTSIINILNYSNATTYKTTLSRSGTMSGSYQGTDMEVGLWRSTAAINAIKLFPDGGSFTTGSSFTLYGIKAA